MDKSDKILLFGAATVVRLAPELGLRWRTVEDPHGIFNGGWGSRTLQQAYVHETGSERKIVWEDIPEVDERK